MIIGRNVSKTYTGDLILDNVDFKIGQNRKIGIVGKNGCGKSTLLNIISGHISLDNGSIDKLSEVVAYIPQEFTFESELVGEHLEKFLDFHYETYKIEMLVEKLDFSNFDMYQQISTLSEGQKMKIKIIEAMLGDPTIVLIDEPTNHLDIEGILWFEKYIKRLNKTVVMISHDREFLNNTVDEIWEIENKKIIKFVGDYDNYKEEKLKLIDKWNEEYIRFLAHKRKLDKLLTNVRKIKDGKSRGKAVQAAKKRIAREIAEKEVVKYEETKMQKVQFDTDITHQKLMLRFDNVAKNYKEKNVLKDLSFDIRGGQKVWLYGPNGTGKTTVVKMIMKQEMVTSGEIIIGSNMNIGYFAQKQTHLEYDKNLLEYFVQQTGCFYGSAYGILSKFLFTKDDLQKPIKSLSPGQRARFAFSIFSYKDYDFLILDEPSNHLDIETKEVIEQSLKEFKGTLLLVSHDRFFVERVGITHMLNLKEGRVEGF